MAPNLDKEAEHIRNKARKELLGLLEGVSKADSVRLLTTLMLNIWTGSRQEESCDR